MNTEQSYENVAPGATAPQQTTLLNLSKTKVHVTDVLADMLTQPEVIHDYRTILRAWFLNYLDPEGQRQVFNQEINVGFFDVFDGWLDELFLINTGRYDNRFDREPQTGFDDNNLPAYVQKINNILDKQNELAVLIFGDAALQTAGKETHSVARQVQKGLFDCQRMLDELKSAIQVGR